MSNNTAAADVAGGGPSASAFIDRHFLAVNGALQGPFTQRQLNQQPPASDAWLWHVGMPDWAPWQADTAVERPPSTASAQLFWLSLGTRGKAAGAAAALEVRAVQARREVTVARQDLDAVCQETGRLVIESNIVLDDVGLTAKLSGGRELVASLDAVDADIAQQRSQLDRTDPKSQTAARSRTFIAEQQNNRAELVRRLSVMQVEFGRRIHEHDGDKPEELSRETDRYQQALKRLGLATAAVDSVQQQRIDANARIGTSFRVVAAAAIMMLVAAVLLVTKLAHRSPAVPAVASNAPGTSQMSAPVSNATAAPTVDPNLSREQLRLASALVVTSWKAYPNVTQACSGSAAALSVQPNGVMQLITNRHVLNLSELMKAKTDRGVFVGEYQVQIKFPSGRVCPVLRVHPESTNIDLALLDLDARTLQEGVDYVLMQPLPAGTELEPGDEVVAVGNPSLGDEILENTQTFGHISSLRDAAIDGVTTKLIQTDCPLNHGNSGGPLLLRSNGRHFWAGINTSGASPGDGYQGLNFAIDARQAISRKFWDYPATPAGIAGLLNEAYHVPAATYTP